jgi:hypothetical protein
MKVKETLQTQLTELDNQLYDLARAFEAELKELVDAELLPLMLDDNSIESTVQRYGVTFKRAYPGLVYKKDFLDIRFRGKDWNEFPVIGVELSVYSTSDDYDNNWNKERLIMVGKIAEYFVYDNSKEYFMASANAIHQKYVEPNEKLELESRSIRKAIETLNKQDEADKKSQQLQAVRSQKGIAFNYFKGTPRNRTKAASLAVRFNDGLYGLATLRIIKESASGQSATIEYSTWTDFEDGKDENGYSKYTKKVSYLRTYDRVKMVNILNCLSAAGKEDVIAIDGIPTLIEIGKPVEIVTE